MRAHRMGYFEAPPVEDGYKRKPGLAEPLRYPQCGTGAGAKLHSRRGERACEECRLARNRERRDFAARARVVRPPAG